METNETSTAPLTDHGAHDTQPCLPAYHHQSSKDARKLSSDAEVLSSEKRELSSAHAVLSNEKQLSNGEADHQKRQKRMGPAPFASFEDLSDEIESPDEQHLSGAIVRLPDIREDITPTTPSYREHNIEFLAPSGTTAEADLEDTNNKMAQHSGISVIGVIATGPTASSSTSAQSTSKMSIQPPTTPRIDISRASSSSHHDSKDSTPEREIFEGNGEGQSAKLGLGFKEDGAMDLRASTEELDFHDPEEAKKSKSRATSPSPGPDENYRKDSQCSDIVLLSISGRTSRLSSIGSAGSGQSRLSNASHLSVMSGHSNLSRCSSPHKMLLETSFCGYKSPDTQSLASEAGTNIEDEEIEKLLLSRKYDPTQAFIAEGIKVEKSKVIPEKPARKGSENPRNDIRIKVDKPEDNSKEERSKIPRKIISKSGVEYTYIPLKGPLPLDDSETDKSQDRISKSAPLKTRTVPASASQRKSSKSASQTSKSSSRSKTSGHSKSASSSRSSSQSKNVTLPKPEPQKQGSTDTKQHQVEPKYIRIKLKPDHCYSDEVKQQSTSKPFIQNIAKPDSLDLNLPGDEKISLSQPNPSVIKITPKFENASLSNSPKLGRHKPDHIESVTPSPSISRRSSFASLFKSKDAISPESPILHGLKKKAVALPGILKPGERERSRSRSKSRERDANSAAASSSESIDSKTKHKSVLSIFKTSKKDKKSDSEETIHTVDGLGKLEFKFNEPSKTKREKPLEADSIRIPLHSPTYYETDHKLDDWKTSSQDSQETVIDASTRKNVNVVIEATPQLVEDTNAKDPEALTTHTKLTSRRSSSIDSQNVVFSTKIGAENEVFSVKLPKQKTISKQGNVEKNDNVEASTTENRKESEDIGTKKEEDTKTRPKSITDEAPKPNKSFIETNNSLEHPRSIDEPIKSVSHNSSKDKRESMLSVTSSKSINLDEERNNSSESERDSEMEYPRVKKELELKSEQDPDREAIVLQQDSFEDELPYVPTTLPQERSAAVPIVPIKQRATLEMRTCPIERPRSTTPTHKYIISSELEGSNIDKSENVEKLKISLPRHDSVHKRTKSADISDSPKILGGTNLTQTIQSPKSSTSVQKPQTDETTPPPLPPKGVQKSWVNFEDIPEKRKPPKRIQTIPSRGHIDVPDVIIRENVVYTYVDPEECKCECHEQGAKERDRRKPEPQTSAVQEDELPLLEDEVDDKDEKSSSYHKTTDIRKTESAVSNGVKKDPLPLNSQCTSSQEVCMISSNRPSVTSQDDLQSPNNAFPKNS